MSHASIALILCLLYLPLQAQETPVEAPVTEYLLNGHGALDEFDAIKQLPVGKDKPARFIMGDINGFLHVFEAQENGFEEIWSSEYLEGAIGGIFVRDVDNDDLEEIIFFTDKGRFHFLDIESYNILWSNPPNEYESITSMLLHNIDDDAQPELIFCADGRLTIYDGRDQFEVWHSEQTDLTASEILVGDVDGDGTDEIILNQGYVFDSRFHDLEWQSPEPFGERMGILDVDADNIPEIIGEFRGQFLRVFDVDLRREKSVKR